MHYQPFTLVLAYSFHIAMSHAVGSCSMQHYAYEIFVDLAIVKCVYKNKTDRKLFSQIELKYSNFRIFYF